MSRAPEGGRSARVPAVLPSGVESERVAVVPLLALQRAAGNAAVARLISARAYAGARPGAPFGRGVLSRYEAGEHARFGDDEKVMVNGVPISKGNIIAMGDFFRTPEDMYKAPPDVLTKLDAAITQDKNARLGGKDAQGQPLKTPSNDDIQKITAPLGEGNTYMDLNKENFDHFAPPKGGADPDGKDHKSAFERFHRQALDEAKKGGGAMSTVDPQKKPEPIGPPAPPPEFPGPLAPPQTSDGDGTSPAPSQASGATPPDHIAATVPPQAIATNMFAAHFLTDAFAAGHLINKQEVIDQARETWKTMQTSGFLLKENSFTQQVSQRVLADSGVKGKMADMEIIDLRGIAGGLILGPVTGGAGVAAYSEVTPEKLSELLHLTSRLDPGTFFNIFARMVHDKLNREGVEVTNGIDAPWKLSGDETLNEESLAIGRKAVEESEKNLEEAARAPGDLPYDEMIERVWKFVPHPTENGQKFIDKVRDELTNAANPEAVDEAVKLSVAEIDTAIDQMIQMHILRKKGEATDPATTASGPAAPSVAPPPDGGTPTPRKDLTPAAAP
jgi:hypothetical protein